MKQETKIWIWIAVAVIVIASIATAGFILLKKSDNDDSNETGGENADFTPAGNGSSSNSNSGSSSNSSSSNETSTDSSIETKAIKLYNAIDYFWGTKQKDIYEVFKSVSTIEEIKSILEKYESLYGISFEADLHSEVLGESTLESINGILKNKGFDVSIGLSKSYTKGIY